MTNQTEENKVVVVGAGFSGLGNLASMINLIENSSIEVFDVMDDSYWNKQYTAWRNDAWKSILKKLNRRAKQRRARCGYRRK